MPAIPPSPSMPNLTISTPPLSPSLQLQSLSLSPSQSPHAYPYPSNALKQSPITTRQPKTPKTPQTISARARGGTGSSNLKSVERENDTNNDKKKIKINKLKMSKSMKNLSRSSSRSGPHTPPLSLQPLSLTQAPPSQSSSSPSSKASKPNKNTYLTETQTLGNPDSEYHDNYAYLDLSTSKAVFIKSENEKLLHIKARQRLRQLAEEKFGSINELFKVFDVDSSGNLSLNEFSVGMKKRNLERMFNRDQQRLLFKFIDVDGSDLVDVGEFRRFLERDDFDGRRPSDVGGYGNAFSNVQTYNQTKVKETKMNPRVQKIKDILIASLISKHASSKPSSSSVQSSSDYLLQAFKQWDTTMSGYLTPDEFVSALCESDTTGGLHLKIPRDDIKLVLSEIDKDCNGEISYLEFSRFLRIHDIDPEYNPFFDSRERGINNLKRIVNKPWAFQKETDEANETKDMYLLKLQNDKDDESFRKSVLIREKEHEFDSEDGIMLGKRRPHTTFTSTFSSMKEPLDKMNTSQELFNSMHNTQLQKMSSICPRFTAPLPTDWTRVGYGGNGIDENSGIYQPLSMALTTNNEYYPPLLYIPNKGVTRNLTSDADRCFLERRDKVLKRRIRTEDNIKVIRERVKREETMHLMNASQKLTSKAEGMLTYYSKVYNADYRLQTKAESMVRKSHVEAAERMWGGSVHSPFHVNHVQSLGGGGKRFETTSMNANDMRSKSVKVDRN